MSIYKKISIALLMISMIILFVACRNHVKLNNKEEVFFPKGDNGYPQNNIVMINGKQYLLKHIETATNNSHVIHEIDLELSDETEGMVEVILPQNNPINFWSIEMNEEIDFISYHKIEFDIEDKDMIHAVVRLPRPPHHRPSRLADTQRPFHPNIPDTEHRPRLSQI